MTVAGRRLDPDQPAPADLMDALARPGQPPRRGGWPGPRKTAWAFKPDADAVAAVERYMATHGLFPQSRGDRTKALNAMLATHPNARPATPTDTEETHP